MENKNINAGNIRVDIPRPSLFAASSLILLAAIGLWVSMLVLSFAGGFENAMDAASFTNAVYYLPFIILPIILYMLKRRGLSDAMRLNPMPVFPLVSVILLAFLCTMIASMLVSIWSIPLEALGLSYPDTAFVPADSRELMLSIIVVAAVPAVCEELLFRGVVLSAWESRGTKYAIIVSSIFFALIHGNIFGWPAYFFVSLIAGYLVFSLDSIYAGIIFHTVYNTACLVISYMMENSSAAEQAAAMQETISASDMALTMIVDFVMMSLMLVFTLRILRTRRKLMGIEPIPRIHQPLSVKEQAMILLYLVPIIMQYFFF